MPFTHFDHLTNLEKDQVLSVFRGWRREYLEELTFKRVDDGWMVRDQDLRATQYMHIESNGGQGK